MNDAQRLAQIKALLNNQSGLDATTFEQLNQVLTHHSHSNADEHRLLKVAFFDAKSYDLAAFEQQNHQRFVIIPIDVPLSESTAVLANGCDVACLFVNDQGDEAAIEQLARMNIRLIALRCAGFNNIDLAACEKYNIDVVRVPEYSPHAVSEHTIALMLMLNRQLHRAYLRNRVGQFLLDGLVGFDMYNKTVGVVGTGKIGRCVIDALVGLGCNILAYDANEHPELVANPNVNYVSLETLAQSSDIITLHLPLTHQTYHLVNAALIAKMKPGVMIINTSRGGLVDTQALVAGLKSAHIGSAGLDVYEEEGGIFFHDISGQVWNDEVFARLMTFNNVVITSHQGFLTHEALNNIAQTTLSSIEEYAHGQRLTYKVANDLP